MARTRALRGGADRKDRTTSEETEGGRVELRDFRT